MPHEEMGFGRDGVFSAWHRAASIERYVGRQDALRLMMIDIDAGLWVETNSGEKEPLALIETARDNGQAIKPTTILRRLAIRCGRPAMPAYAVLYKPSESMNPAMPNVPDIESFRVRRIWPTPENDWQHFRPLEFAQELQRIRRWGAELRWPDLYR